MTVFELFSVPENREAYASWVRSPETQKFLGVVANMIKPLGLGTATGETALYNLGLYVGMSSVMDAIQHLETFDPQSPAGRARMEELRETYGADEILAGMGYKEKPQAQKEGK